MPRATGRSTKGRANRWACPVVIFALVAMMLANVDSASAGAYIMRSCNVPGAGRTTVGPWNWEVRQGAFANDECAIGGGFGVNAGAMPAGLVPGVHLLTPSGIVIRRVRLWLTARLRGTGSSMTAQVTSGNLVTTQPGTILFGPPGGDTLGSPFESPALASDTVYYDVFAACSGDAGPTCIPEETKILDIRGAEVTLDENVVPTGSIDGGELMTAGAQSGVRALGFTATDHESGVLRVSALIGNTVVGAVDYQSDCPFENFAACRQERTSTVPVDTRKVPNGFYPVSLRVTDAAGNEQMVQSPTAIQVLNTSGGAQSDSASPPGLRLTASFAKNRHASITVGYGARASIRGRLLQQDGPVGGAHIDVEERSGSRTSLRAAVTTNADGSFSYAARRGPSRTLTFAYGAAATQALKLRVAASATLRIALNGVIVRYGGRVLSKPLPRKGKLVEIQGRAPGAGWTTFGRRRTNRRGDFSGSYRLRVHRPGVRLQFRVRIPSEAGYPFVTHAGRAVGRTVR
jgi:hypothetical protein